MDNRTIIEGYIGSTLGDKGKGRKQALVAARKKGLTGLNEATISRIKSGNTSGEIVRRRLEASRVLEADDASRKNSVYLLIANTGMEKRAPHTVKTRAGTFRSNGFVEDIGQELGIDDEVIRTLLRAMRADVATQISSDQNMQNLFASIAKRYINAERTKPTSLQSPSVIKLDEGWDQATAQSFYSSFYTNMSDRALGTWTPYEVEIFQKFYEAQAERGNHLTVFDRLILQKYIEGNTMTGVISEIRGIGVKIEDNVVEQHKNVLLYQRPVVHPQIPHPSPNTA